MITLMGLLGATISAVKIRAVTLGLDLPVPEVVSAPFEEAARFLTAAKQAFESVGVEVQTTRVAGPDLGSALSSLGVGGLAGWAARTEAAARGAGIDYLALGRLPAWAHEVVAEQVAPILAAGEVGFLSADLVDGRLPSVATAGACA